MGHDVVLVNTVFCKEMTDNPLTYNLYSCCLIITRETLSGIQLLGLH